MLSIKVKNCAFFTCLPYILEVDIITRNVGHLKDTQAQIKPKLCDGKNPEYREPLIF